MFQLEDRSPASHVVRGAALLFIAALITQPVAVSASTVNIATHPHLDGEIARYICFGQEYFDVRPNDAMKRLGVAEDPRSCKTVWENSRVYDSFDTFEVPSGAEITSVTYGFNVVTIIQYGQGATNPRWRIFWDNDKLHYNGLDGSDWGSLTDGWVDFDPEYGAGWKSMPLPTSAFQYTHFFDIEVRDISARPSPADGYRWNIRAVQEGLVPLFDTPRLTVEYTLAGRPGKVVIPAKSPGVDSSTWGAIKATYE